MPELVPMPLLIILLTQTVQIIWELALLMEVDVSKLVKIAHSIQVQQQLAQILQDM